jgi:hypothetical protein
VGDTAWGRGCNAWQGSDLFKGLDHQRMHKYIVAYTSNVQRTLFSAWSFLHGMFPNVPKHFSFATDRLKVNLKVDLVPIIYDTAAHHASARAEKGEPLDHTDSQGLQNGRNDCLSWHTA